MLGMLEPSPFPIARGADDRELTLDSTLQDLHLHDFQIDISRPGRELARAFDENTLLPGAILTQNGCFCGMISRRRFLELMSRPYSLELFSRRSLESLYRFAKVDVLVCAGDLLISTAAHQCLARSPELLYEPIVVVLDERTYRLIDVHKLLVVKAQLYEMAMSVIAERTAELDRANAEITSLNDRLRAENLRLHAELEVTRQLQQMLLPKSEELQQIEGLDIAGFMEPATEVGGDYYDVLQHNGKVKIGIGDVTGHGLESGVLMLMVQTAVRTLLADGETDPVRFLNTLNRTIYGNIQRMKTDKHITLALLDYDRGEIRLSGQHEEAIVVRSNGQIECIDTLDLGFPIGLEEDISPFISQTSIKLEVGDVLVLYTDGITEAENCDRQFYGLKRLCRVVRQFHHCCAQEIQRAIVADWRQHVGNWKVYDDITLLILKQK
ncbi:MAG TPA: SpoIIE family protein phosphatase [Oscillatoriales cyanobacterium M4454_W2019_049]|nr:SpoIIE family protein phosphatase [Oscillatoriales cyanobacterium M4454_W2019_049]